MRPRNRFPALALLLVTAGCASQSLRAGARPGAPSTRDWHDAVNLLQSDDTSGVILDSLLVADVAAGLARIRATYPELRTMEFGPDRTYLVITLDSAASLEVTRRARNDYSQRSLATALRPSPLATTLDSFARPYGVQQREIRVVGPTWLELRINFQRPVNVWPVAEIYRRVPHVRFAGPERDLGGGDGIGLAVGGPVLRFYFVQRWGDCPAWCLFSRATPITYDRRTGAVRREPEVGDPYPT